MTLSLRSRLSIWYTALVALLLAALSVVSYRVLARQLDDDATARLTELTNGIHGYLRVDENAPAFAFDASDSDVAAFVEEATRYYQIFEAETGRLVVQSTAMQLLGLHFTPAEVDALVARLQPFDITTQYGRFRITNSIVDAGSGHPMLLQVGSSLSQVDAALSRYRSLLLWHLPIAIALAALGAWAMARLALSPLSRFAAAATSIDVNSLGQRLPLRGAGDELDTVACAFNETLARLEHSVLQMRQFSTALAHELRTPLAALRGEIELTLRRAGADDSRRETLGSQLEELDRLSRLIDEVLTLARAESGQIPLAFAPVDLEEIARRIVELLEPLAKSRGIDLRIASASPAVVEGDVGLLQRLLLNLLDNALKFTTTGGQITLCVLRQHGRVRVDVRDTGVGISPDAVPHVFDPFFRADPARSADGAGLGLTLAKWIVDAHGGRITVDSRPGNGSTFTVVLPAFRGAHLHFLHTEAA